MVSEVSRKEDQMLFNSPKVYCAFCASQITEYGWRERGKLYCNEYCASDEEETDRANGRTTLEQLELELGVHLNGKGIL